MQKQLMLCSNNPTLEQIVTLYYSNAEASGHTFQAFVKAICTHSAEENTCYSHALKLFKKILGYPLYYWPIYGYYFWTGRG